MESSRSEVDGKSLVLQVLKGCLLEVTKVIAWEPSVRTLADALSGPTIT